MLGRRHSILPVVIIVSIAGLLLAPSGAWAYVGPGPGMELVPFFQSLVVWIGLGLGASLLWPVQALISRLRRGRTASPEVAKSGKEACAAA
jgi:hypothetical protein